MAGFLIFIAVIAYLVFLVNWKDFIGLLGKGGWVALALYVVLTGLIVTTLVNPHIPHLEEAGHHQSQH